MAMTVLGSLPSIVGDFRKLTVWRKAHALAMNVNREADGMRAKRHASLRNQMIRAAMSIPTNIVEGSSQDSRREFARFLRIARNSGSELEYHLLAARDMKAITLTNYASLAAQTVEVKKMLHGLIARVMNPSETTQRKVGAQ